MYDPIEMAGETREVVCRGDRRKYYRFRPARFYGGIATADCVGCCLRCVYCWSWREVANPERIGEWHSPEHVASTLIGIAERDMPSARTEATRTDTCTSNGRESHGVHLVRR